MGGKPRLRLSAAIRSLGIKLASLLIDAINGIEYDIGMTSRPLDRYDIPVSHDRVFVRELVRNVIGLESAGFLVDMAIHKGRADTRYYTVRYDESRFKAYALRLDMAPDAFDRIMDWYVKLLAARLGGSDRVKLLPSGGRDQPLISVQCYDDPGRTGNVIGEGNVNKIGRAHV